MVSVKEASLMRRMFAIVKKEGILESLELQNKCGNMSISTYNKLKRPFLKTYDDKIGFQKHGDNHFFYDLQSFEKSEQEKLIKEIIIIDNQ